MPSTQSVYMSTVMENNGEKERGREEGKEKECDEETLAFLSADLGTRATEEIGDGAKARGERKIHFPAPEVKRLRYHPETEARPFRLSAGSTIFSLSPPETALRHELESRQVSDYLPSLIPTLHSLARLLARKGCVLQRENETRRASEFVRSLDANQSSLK